MVHRADWWCGVLFVQNVHCNSLCRYKDLSLHQSGSVIAAGAYSKRIMWIENHSILLSFHSLSNGHLKLVLKAPMLKSPT